MPYILDFGHRLKKFSAAIKTAVTPAIQSISLAKTGHVVGTFTAHF